MRDLLDQAREHHRAGRLDLAGPIYAEILRHIPDHPDALHLMGVMAIQTGRFADALDWIARALAARPDFPEAHNNLGNAFRALGRPDQAATAFRAALDLRPDFPEALNNLGVCRQAASEFGEAATLFRHALDLRPNYPEAAINLAQTLEQAGRPAEAVEAYAAACSLVPTNADLHNLHGNSLRMVGKTHEAAEAYANAVRLRPDFVEFRVNLGVALTECRRTADAIEHLGRARSQAPDHARAATALGVALDLNGQGAEAVACLREAVALAPGFAAAHGNLGLALVRQGLLDEAAECQRNALALQPDHAAAHTNLAVILTEQGQWDAALDEANEALRLSPAMAEAHLARGNLLKAMGRLDEAESALNRALDLAPTSAEAHTALGTLYQARWQLDEAEARHRAALALWPDFTAAEINLGGTMQVLGRNDEAAACYERVLARVPDHVDAFGNLLNATMYRDDLSDAAIADIHRRYGAAMARPRLELPPLAFADDPERRLRIGYLSSDLRNHPVASNLWPVARRHDKSRVSLHFYSQLSRPDEYTDRFRSVADGWRDIQGLSDRQAAELIRSDRIDILVSLAGRFDRNRPTICAWRAAPIQISLYEVATSGLDEMDFLIGDGCLQARPSHEYFTERRLRLHRYYAADFPESLPPLPAVPLQGPAVFCCFNNPAKITPGLARSWGRILKALPRSRLVLKYQEAYASSALRGRLGRHLAEGGATTGQVEFIAQRDTYDSFLARYNQADFALDTQPFSGSTTTFQALTMGVPVLTLSGERMVGRWTASMLRGVKLGELIANSEEDYLARAIGLAETVEHWRGRRADIREAVRTSSLCDGARWTRNLERLYRAIWRRKCHDDVSIGRGARLRTGIPH